MCVFLHAYDARTYIHTYIHIYIHTYMHTYTHTHALFSLPEGMSFALS